MGHRGKPEAGPAAIPIDRIIDAGQIDQLLETHRRIIAQRLSYGQVITGADLQGQLTPVQHQVHHPTPKGVLENLTQAFQLRTHFILGVQRAMVLVRLILFCNWIMP